MLGKNWPLCCLVCDVFLFCHFPCGVLGQVWYLIISISDLCLLSYFNFGIYKDLSTLKSDIHLGLSGSVYKLAIFSCFIL